LNAPVAGLALRDFKNPLHLGGSMGLDITTVQRMFLASLIAGLGVWYLQGALMDGMLTLVALCTLTALVWGLSERETTFEHLNLKGNGPWSMLGVLASIVIFAQVSVAIWAFPTVGAYVLSLTFIGSFWVTGYMMQPSGA
jgi:hypothetical protein